MIPSKLWHLRLELLFMSGTVTAERLPLLDVTVYPGYLLLGERSFHFQSWCIASKISKFNVCVGCFVYFSPLIWFCFLKKCILLSCIFDLKWISDLIAAFGKYEFFSLLYSFIFYCNANIYIRNNVSSSSIKISQILLAIICGTLSYHCKI